MVRTYTKNVDGFSGRITYDITETETVKKTETVTMDQIVDQIALLKQEILRLETIKTEISKL